MFSRTCEYAIRAMIFLAQRSAQGGRTGIKEIAEHIGSPEAFIAKILQGLGRQGLVRSAKGPTGGFYLEAGDGKTSLADVVKAIDGESLFSGCGLGLRECSETHPCPLHNEFKKIRRDIYQLLEKTKLGSFNEKTAEQLVFLKSR